MNFKKIKSYEELIDELELFEKDKRKTLYRDFCLNDLYFLLRYVLKREDVEHQWILNRCNEVQASPDWHLDLWSRSHYKSTIITFAKSIQDILRNPDITISIFSHTRNIAKTFLKQIRIELESNELLKYLFPDILWENPSRDSPRWSDEGIIVKRKSNPKEATLEAWGIVDGQPTSRHFNIMVYDDIVTAESVYTKEMIEKTLSRWELSTNLLSNNGICRYIGTRYSLNDLYSVIIERGLVKPRIYPATIDGTVNGVPVLLTREQLKEKRLQQGEHTFAAQMLQNPIHIGGNLIKEHWWKYYKILPQIEYKIIVADTAMKTKEQNDFSVLQCWGYGKDGNAYLIDQIRGKWEAPELLRMTIAFWNKHNDGTLRELLVEDKASGTGLIQTLKREYKIPVFGIKPDKDKVSRVLNITPQIESGFVLLPEKARFIIDFLQECVIFPSGKHDDQVDCLAYAVDRLLIRKPKKLRFIGCV
jgi:predicted phage terminase large subunit-like protein